MNKDQLDNLALQCWGGDLVCYKYFDHHKFLALVDAERAKEQKPLQPCLYWESEDYEMAYDCIDDSDLLNSLFPEGAKVGDEYLLSEAYYFPAHFRIVKIPDGTNDDYEVERVNGTDVYIRPQPIPEGYKLVPAEPTKEMNEAFWERYDCEHFALTGAYKAMLAAAPEEKP